MGVKMINNKIYGSQAENEFIKILNQNGIPYKFIDDWYDFEIYNQKVEIKSTQLSHKFSTPTKTQSYKIGRFLFTEEQRKNKIFCGLFVRFKENFLFLGIIKLKEDTPKYISIHKIRDYKIYSIQDFLELTRGNVS